MPSLDLATRTRLVSKVVRCLFKDVCLNSVSKNINRVEYKAINIDTLQQNGRG